MYATSCNDRRLVRGLGELIWPRATPQSLTAGLNDVRSSPSKTKNFAKLKHRENLKATVATYASTQICSLLLTRKHCYVRSPMQRSIHQSRVGIRSANNMRRTQGPPKGVYRGMISRGLHRIIYVEYPLTLASVSVYPIRRRAWFCRPGNCGYIGGWG